MKAIKWAAIAAGFGVITMLKQSSAPRGIRNNNPLNIEYNAANQWQGQVGTDGRFAIFENAFFGIRAGARLLKTYRDKYGLNTVAGIINKFAPDVENDTNSYIKSVAQRAKVLEFAPLSDAEYIAVITAMIYHENGQQPYSQTEIIQAVQHGLS